jgi:hypothetical protein
MNKEPERIRRNFKCKYYPSTCLEVLEKTQTLHTQDNQCLGQGCGVGVGRNFYVELESTKMYRLRLRPQSKIFTRYSNSRALIAKVTIRFIFKYRL